jgi:hypothetical protein
VKRMKSGGSWGAIRCTLRIARKVGFWQLWQAMRAKNTGMTCALGMGDMRTATIMLEVVRGS